MTGQYRNTDGGLSEGVVVERGTLGFDAFTVLRGGTIQLAVGSTPTAAPVRLPAMSATIAIVESMSAAANSFVYWALDAAGAAAPTPPVPYAATGTGGNLGDRPLVGNLRQVVTLSAQQQALLAAGNLYLSAVGSAVTLQVTFGNNL